MIENWTSPSYIRSFPTIGSIVSGAKIVIDETITMSNVVLLSMKNNDIIIVMFKCSKSYSTI